MDKTKPAAETADKIESPAERLARIEAENEALRAELAKANETITAAEEQAIAQLQMGSSVEEIACGFREVEKKDKLGNTVTRRVKRLDADGQVELDDDGKEITDKVPVMDKVPVYRFRIDLPASGGLGLIRNGFTYYHDESYEFTAEELRDVKDQVARAWQHERSINGTENENAFRRPQNRQLRGNERRARA